MVNAKIRQETSADYWKIFAGPALFGASLGSTYVRGNGEARPIAVDHAGPRLGRSGWFAYPASSSPAAR